MKKKLLCIFLAVIMLLALMPTQVFASRDDNSHGIQKSIGWNYAKISEKNNGGYNVDPAYGSDDLSSHVTVTSGGTGWSKGSSRYSLTKNATGQVTITADPGYYIAYVVLCCNDGNGYSCRTSASENAYGYAYSETPAQVTLDLAKLYEKANHQFSHNGDWKYWLMIMVKGEPTPVYVGYDVGSISTASANDLSTYAPVEKNDVTGASWLTDYCTLKYTRGEKAPTVEHTALGINPEAERYANSLGYTFDGWSLQYYNNYTETGNAFSSTVGNPTAKAADDTVKLNTYAKLTAQWKKLETGTLTITKTINAPQDFKASDNEYYFLVTIGGEKYVGSYSFSSGRTGGTQDGIIGIKAGETVTISGIKLPSDYKVEELELSQTGTNSFKFKEAKFTNESGTLTANSPAASVSCENVYEKKTATIVVSKKVSGKGNSGLEAEEYSFSAFIGNDTYNFTLKDGEQKIFSDIPFGTYYQVKESQDNATWNASIIAESGTVNSENINIGFVNTYVYENEDLGLTGDVTIEKFAPGDELTPIANTEFTVYSDKALTKAVFSGKTDESGLLTLQGLEGNKVYYMKETAAADGYIASDTVYTIDTTESVTTEPEVKTEGYQKIIYTATEWVPHVYAGDSRDDLLNSDKILAVKNIAERRIALTKVWDDDRDKDQIRPDEITVIIKANGQDYGKVTITAEKNWKATIAVPATDDEGNDITYTVVEEEIEGYTASYSEDTFTITNTHEVTPDEEVKTVSKTITKKWDDKNSKDRPSEITVQLYADGKAQGDPVKVTADAQWTYTWKDLAKSADGKDIEYTVKEVNVPKGYKASYSKDTFTITNTLETTPSDDKTPDNKNTDNKTTGGVSTGDTANTTLWLCIAAAAMVAAITCIAISIKKKARNAKH